MKIKDKVIVITGASSGLGRETAIHLSRLGGKVVLVARSKKKLIEVQSEIEKITGESPFFVCCDISSEKDIVSMAAKIKEKHGHVDVLINNAGIGIHKNSEEITNAEMRKQFEVNFYGAFYCIKSLIPLIKTSYSGYILNICSLVSKISFADNSTYAATKFALLGFTEGLRLEMKKYDIKVGAFLPGFMNTPFQKDRKGEKNPQILMVKTKDAAKKIEKMIIKRKQITYMHKWMFLIMKIGQMFK